MFSGFELYSRWVPLKHSRYEVTATDLCIGQIEASTCPPSQGNPPRHLTFLKIVVQIPPTRAKMPFKCPTLGSIQVIKFPQPGDILQAQK